MWSYQQSTGNLTDPKGTTYYRVGYSGRDRGLNNSLMQDVPDIGPIPQGLWLIDAEWFDDPEKGPMVVHLIPLFPTDVFGRDGFMIHGDNEEMNHTASEGCLILPRVYRQAIKDSGDTRLEVIA